MMATVWYKIDDLYYPDNDIDEAIERRVVSLIGRIREQRGDKGIIQLQKMLSSRTFSASFWARVVNDVRKNCFGVEVTSLPGDAKVFSGKTP